MIEGSDSKLKAAWLLSVVLERAPGGGGREPMVAKATIVIIDPDNPTIGVSGSYPIDPANEKVSKKIEELESAIEDAIAPTIWGSHQPIDTGRGTEPGFVPSSAATAAQLNANAQINQLTFE